MHHTQLLLQGPLCSWSTVCVHVLVCTYGWWNTTSALSLLPCKSSRYMAILTYIYKYNVEIHLEIHLNGPHTGDARQPLCVRMLTTHLVDLEANTERIRLEDNWVTRTPEPQGTPDSLMTRLSQNIRCLNRRKSIF